MANICSIDMNVEFESKAAAEAFAAEFRKEMDEAAAKDEGTPLAADAYLFDAVLEKSGETGIMMRGWVKWGLSHEAARGFAERLRGAGMTAFSCSYEEVGNRLFGEYEWDGEDLFDKFVPENHPVWESIDEDCEDSFESLERVLETDCECLMAA